MPLYFAYGANMDSAAMRLRAPNSRALGRARLARHKFFIMKSGYASVRRDPHANVEGVLFDLALSDVPALDRFEEVGRGLYTKAVQPVLREGAQPVRALVYIGAETAEGRPAAAYLESILAGRKGARSAARIILPSWRPSAARRQGRARAGAPFEPKVSEKGIRIEHRDRARRRSFKERRRALARRRRTDRAGADDGRLACGAFVACAGSAVAGGSRYHVDLRQPDAIRTERGFCRLSAQLREDVAAFAAAAGDLVFAPEVAEVYPPGFVTKVSLGGPATAGLEDKFRPDHFAGVATIVAKLLIMAAPDVAVFGEKDYQQLAVIRRMARDLNLEAEIVGAPTIRAADGLALSSRNVYLGSKERRVAPLLHAALERCRAAILQGAPVEVCRRWRARRARPKRALPWIMSRRGTPIRWRRSPRALTGPIRLLVAARIGGTRLIDNIGV